MTSVGEHIQHTNKVICENISQLGDRRGILSQNILAQLRNLVEGTAVLLCTGSAEAEYDYERIKEGLEFIRAKGQYGFLGRFHKHLQTSASHYTVDGDSSERLMLKYYDYLLQIRTLLKKSCGVDVLSNLESFPLDLDPSLREYHEKIAERIESLRLAGADEENPERYYIHGIRPFSVEGKTYYEVTFYRAINRVGKFDRMIAFTDIKMTDDYSAMLTLHRDAIYVLGHDLPITIISGWRVSIRPCEFDNFARLLGITIKTSVEWAEYQKLMEYLTKGSGNLLDLMDMSDHEYGKARACCMSPRSKPQIFSVLDEARRVIRSGCGGSTMLRFLMLHMRNEVLRSQYDPNSCPHLSKLNLKYGCIPFDDMPFCSSPVGHNVKYGDLVESLGVAGRDHELLARRVKINVENHGMLYTSVEEFKVFGDVAELIKTYNSKIYYKHRDRRKLVQDKGHVFIQGYENDTVAIMKKLRECASAGIDGYAESAEKWLGDHDHGIDDEGKKDALKRLFSQSKVVLIYGAAGTGKSTMVGHIAQYFSDKKKLFLAQTNSAKNNLERKVSDGNSIFRTISSHVHRRDGDSEYGLVVIDECSTVSNADLLNVMKETSFELLVLVGDAYQIESIRFGNWFTIARQFIPESAVFELTSPYRTDDISLLEFWGKVRDVRRDGDDLAEIISKNGYSTTLDDSLFEHFNDDGIILCLNYDGLYGVNNVNHFLQSRNSNPLFVWHAATYKVGDPVLFNDSERFSPVIYNNLKGWIVDISAKPGRIQFEVKLDRSLAEIDPMPVGLEVVEGSTVRFAVNDYKFDSESDSRNIRSHDASDEDDDSGNTVVPFQIAYAVSIHKAQGLEYDSVKIVITDDNKDDITHSIFYTAVTRARKNLKIFWSPESQQAVLRKLHRDDSIKDVELLSSRCGLERVTHPKVRR